MLLLLLFIHLHPWHSFDTYMEFLMALIQTRKCFSSPIHRRKQTTCLRKTYIKRSMNLWLQKPISALCLACCNFATAASHTSAQTFQFPAQWIDVIGKSTLAMRQIQQVMHLDPLICAFSILHLTRSLKVKQRRLGGCKCAPHFDMYLHIKYTCV